MTVRSRYAIATGDLAVLSNEWTFEVDGERMSSVMAEVARRQPQGWLYTVDHPFAVRNPKNWPRSQPRWAPPIPEPDELAVSVTRGR
jgi:hypothetical protein